MRVLTVSELKKPNGRGGGRADYPQEGSAAYKVWQALKANAGHAVSLKDVSPSSNLGNVIERLQSYYGLDIRRVSNSGKTYVLAGEWVGAHYTDYCAAAFKAGERK